MAGLLLPFILVEACLRWCCFAIYYFWLSYSVLFLNFARALPSFWQSTYVTLNTFSLYYSDSNFALQASLSGHLLLSPSLNMSLHIGTQKVVCAAYTKDID